MRHDVPCHGNAPSGAGHEVAIGLGSNLGDSPAILMAAWRDLCECPTLVPLVLSPWYRSKPFDMESDHWFINAAALIRTSLAPAALLDLLHAVEAKHGRKRGADTSGYQDRTLDLDLLLYDDLVLDTDRLIVPHPRMSERLFVLAPLADIAAERRHPRSGKTVGMLLADLQRTCPRQTITLIAPGTWP